MPYFRGRDGLKKRVKRLSLAAVRCATWIRFPRPTSDPARRLPMGRVVDDGPDTCFERDILDSGQESLFDASLGAPGKKQMRW